MIRKKILLAALPALLAACALEPKRTEVPTTTRILVQPAQPSESDRLLAYAGKLRKLESREAAGEREQSKTGYLRDKTEFSRLKYALALSLVSSPAEESELIALLEPLVGTPTSGASANGAESSELRTLAQVLHTMAVERRKLREQLRESQAKVSAARREETREGEARALRAKVDELEKKLDALKSIDRSVNRRTEASSK